MSISSSPTTINPWVKRCKSLKVDKLANYFKRHQCSEMEMQQVAEALIDYWASQHPLRLFYDLQELIEKKYFDFTEAILMANMMGREDQGKAMVAVASYGKLGWVELLLEQGADIESLVELGGTQYTPLSMAACNNRVEMIDFLIKRGANVNAQPGLQQITPLMLAAFSGSEEVVRCLLENGANLTLKDWKGDEVLAYLSISDGLTDNAEKGIPSPCLEALVEYGVNLDRKYSKEGACVLLLAAKQNCVPLVRRLLELGCDINSVDNNGCNILMTAIHHGCYEIIPLAIEAGVDLRHTDKNKKNAYEIAVLRGEYQYLPMLAAVNFKAELEAIIPSPEAPVKEGKAELTRDVRLRSSRPKRL